MTRSQSARTLFLSTCGTSLLTNSVRGDPLITQTANHTEAELTPDQRRRLDDCLAQCGETLLAADLPTARRLSAELNGLLSFHADNLSRARTDHHILLHTDTYQGERIAGLLDRFLREHGLLSVELRTFRNLRTSSLEHFQDGVSRLIHWCAQTLPGYREQGYRVAFNLTGGFKGLQGWMQTLGMFYADEVLYIFESGRELIRIPRIPVAIDSAAEALIESHLSTFRLLSLNLSLAEPPDLSGLPEAFFDRLEDEVDLSPWGRLVWENARSKLYPRRLHPSPTPLLIVSDTFTRAAEPSRIDSRRFEALNQRIDDLAHFLLSGRRFNPNRLDLKKLQGKPHSQATHEVDAWSLPGAWRILCHFGAGRLILDDLTEHL